MSRPAHWLHSTHYDDAMIYERPEDHRLYKRSGRSVIVNIMRISLHSRVREVERGNEVTPTSTVSDRFTAELTFTVYN